jgi:hypothetical protein
MTKIQSSVRKHAREERSLAAPRCSLEDNIEVEFKESVKALIGFK